MNRNIIKNVLLRKDLFVPLVFTRRQFDVIKKYFGNKSLSNAEKKAMYTSITKKLKALNYLYKESQPKDYFVQGRNEVIHERLIESKKIIEEYSKEHDKVFVSGSFLFSEQYNDIDIFLIMKRGYKEGWNGKRHLIYLTERRLSQPIFQSAALISISNFIIPRKLNKIKPKLSELMATYHEAVIEVLNKDKKSEMARRLVFDYELFCNNQILSSRELQERLKKVNVKELDFIVKKLLGKLFSKTYLYVELHNYIKTLTESIKNITPNIHLAHFKNIYEELIYGSSRSQESTA